MATPTTWTQEVITCDLCDNSTQQFCNNCQVSLCVKCVSKHVDKFKYQPHDIVHFIDKKMAVPGCGIHPKQRCEVHCKQCDVPVCMKCIIGHHKGHDAVELSDIIESKKQEIKKETQEIESIIIPGYKKKSEETDNQLDIANAKFNELEEETRKDRKFWHQEVDTIFNKFDSMIKSIKESQQTALKSHHSKLSNRVQEMTETVQRNKKILRSNLMSDVTSYKSKLGEYRKMPSDIYVKTPTLKTNTVQGRELRIELGEYQAILAQGTLSSLTDKFSNVSLSKLLEKAKIIASIPTQVKPLQNVACVGVDEAWVGGINKTIRRVDIHGSERSSITCDFMPNDITVTRKGELVYSDSTNRTVNIVRHGRTERLITIPTGWYPVGLCCTRSGDILVSMSTICYKNKIVRYQGNTVKQEIDKDENGQAIYKKGRNSLWVVENSNGDICVSDYNAGIVIVVDKSGRVRFRYGGTSARRKNVFNPEQLVTDSMNQIIVADYNNACLHILDQNGQFLRCVDNCGLDKPVGLSVDSEGRLWVGLDAGEVKVIQYTK